jgi:hypothetical protein
MPRGGAQDGGKRYKVKGKRYGLMSFLQKSLKKKSSGI